MSTSLNSDKLPLTRSEAHTPAMRPQAGEALAQDGSTEPGAARPVAEGMLHPFRVRNFTLLFSGQTVSIIGDALYAVALPWLILTTGGSAEALGLVLAAYGIPRVGSMLVGGWLSDRLRPRRLMLIADTVRMLLVGILAALALWGHPALWQLCAVAVPLVSWRRIHARLHVHLAGDAEQRGPASRQRADDVFDAGREPGGVGLRGRGRGRVHRGRGSGHRRGYLLRFGGFARTDAHSPPRHTQQTRGRRKPGASLSQHPGARCAGQLLALSAHLALDSGHPADVHRDRPLFGRIDRGGAAHAGPRSHARGREQLWHHPGGLGRGRARWEPLRRYAGQTHTQRAGHPPGWPDRGRLDRASPHRWRHWSRSLYADWRRRQQRHHGPALHRDPAGHSAPADGACHGPAHVQLIRAVSSLSSSGRRALEPVWPGDPLSVRRTPAGSGDGVWNDPTSVERAIASVLNAMKCLKPLHCVENASLRNHLTRSPSSIQTRTTLTQYLLS